MVDKVKISIITVCFNAKDSIEKTIQSVIEQIYENYEYIIIDGGSSDGTIDIINKYKDKITCVISEKDNGIYYAMNKGIALATGDWIHFKNSGDLFVSPHTLADVFSHTIDNDTQILHGNCIYTNDWGFLRKKPALATVCHPKEMPVLHPASFVKSCIHKEIKFDVKYKSCGDYNFMLSCLHKGCKFQYIDYDIAIFPIGGYAMRNFKLTNIENRLILKQHGYSVSLIRFYFEYLRGLLYYQFIHLSNIFPLFKRLYIKILLSKGWEFK